MNTRVLDPTAPHGVRSTYLAGCGCTLCWQANARWAKRYRARVAQGAADLPVPADRVADHVAVLRRTMSATAIAVAAGVSPSVVRRLPTQRKVTAANEAALLAVQPGRATGRHYLDATGTRRRMQALAAVGYAPSRVSAAAGITRQNGSAIFTGRVQHVWACNADAIRAVYDRWSMTPYRPTNRAERAHATRLRHLAAARNYAPPLAWDDEAIDDPTATPATATPADTDPCDDVDDVVVHLVTTGHPHHTTRAERDLIIPALAAAGMSDAEIARLCLVVSETVLRARERLGIPSNWRRAA